MRVSESSNVRMRIWKGTRITFLETVERPSPSTRLAIPVRFYDVLCAGVFRAGGERSAVVLAKNVILPGRVPGAFAVFPFHKQSGAVQGILRMWALFSTFRNLHNTVLWIFGFTAKTTKCYLQLRSVLCNSILPWESWQARLIWLMTV